MTVAVPDAGTIERWAWDYVHTRSLAHKLEPPTPPETFERAPVARRLEAPGRPPELRVIARAEKSLGVGSPRNRARALHAFFHHELQAAELMVWAILAFPTAPEAFRRGLVRIALDETRHMRMYAAHIDKLGFRIGDFGVRDWFWTRVPSVTAPAAFVAVMGLGLESANLEHSASFATAFRAAGDDEGARIQELVGLEEIAHVRFGVRWFPVLTGARALEFDAWKAALPPPLTPLLMRGSPIDRAARVRAGQPDPFIDELERWTPGS